MTRKNKDIPKKKIQTPPSEPGPAWPSFWCSTWPRIEFGKTLKDDEAAYFVRDNGAGFDMAYVDKLFGLRRSGKKS